MNQDYILADAWSIIEEGFDKDRVKASESLFSLGNGAMGQRANFEETYSGPSFQGSYIAGVYYPDKTRVGWWKNGYPEYFAKVLNAPNWIGIDLEVDGIPLDLDLCSGVRDFKRELNMREGWLRRSFVAILPNSLEIEVVSTRFLSLAKDELGAINYRVTAINGDAVVLFKPYIDAGIHNMDSNWDDKFWNTTKVEARDNRAFIHSHTMKTGFNICTFMQAHLTYGEVKRELPDTRFKAELSAGVVFAQKLEKGVPATLIKYGGYTVDRNHDANGLKEAANSLLDLASSHGFDQLLEEQKKTWAGIWEMSDITIEGDVRAQQGIRFNIFQLNQTYTGRDSRLNIGPKGFTGEKYGGSTYWDTEAYCLPFYMSTKEQGVARNLLKYRYDHLEKAIENAEKLGFSNGAALYPMVTMNGEECHNEWEITFEEIHRNAAMAYAIFNYTRYTGDQSYIPEMGLEVLIGIARFWEQRANWSQYHEKYVILGVTGPNEYENNVNNNWYTNYMAKWCLEYTIEQLERVREHFPDDHKRILEKTKFDLEETSQWQKVAQSMYFPYSEDLGLYLQQDGFLDKELIPALELDPKQRPINQHWSWDRILRSPYIKQADTLQGFYFFMDRFELGELERHFDYYESFTLHESSLSPCVHAVLAAKLGRMEQAYEFYLRTSRLDLDDYNKEVEEGLHITSMAGTWISIVEGFGGMRIDGDRLSFSPNIPARWESYSFKVNFRSRIVKVTVTQKGNKFELEQGEALDILVDGQSRTLNP